MLRQKIEDMKDQAEADYEKTRKKKDPEFDRANYHPRFTDEDLYDMVKKQLESPACVNKGFILDGFPRSKDDARAIFNNKVLKEQEGEPAEGEEQEPQYDEVLNQNIVPQYAIALEADDAALTQKAKDLPPEVTENTHWNEAGMVRRLKDFRTKNVDDSGETVKDFITEAIGYSNVLVVDAMSPETE